MKWHRGTEECEGKAAEEEAGQGVKNKIVKHLDCDVKDSELYPKLMGAHEHF